MISANTKDVQKVKALRKRDIARQTSRTIGSWNESSVRSAVTAQIDGDFSSIANLARFLQSDAAFSAALDKRLNTLLRSEYLFTAIKSDSVTQKYSDYIKDAIEIIYDKSISENDLKNILKSYLMIGYGVGYITYESNNGIFTPCLNYLDVEDVRYDYQTKTFVYQTNSDTVNICPGDGNWFVLSDFVPGQPTGFVAKLAAAILQKKYAEKDWSEGNQNHIEAVTIIQETGESPGVEDSDVAAFVGEIQGAKQDKVIYSNHGHSVTFEDAIKSYNPSAFSDLIEYVDRKIQVLVLGQNLSSEVTQGSFAAAQTHRGVELTLIEADEKVLSRSIVEHLLKFVTQFNFGKEAIQYCPEFSYILSESEDTTHVLSNLKTLKEIVGDISKIENIDEILSAVGYNVKKEEQDDGQ